MLTRLKYGVKQELLELVSLKGIGRAKARTLYDRGVRSKEDITRTDAGTIAAMPRIGSALAKSLKEQTGSWNAAGLYEQPEPKEPISIDNEPVKNKGGPLEKGSKQASLFDF